MSRRSSMSGISPGPSELTRGSSSSWSAGNMRSKLTGLPSAALRLLGHVATPFSDPRLQRGTGTPPTTCKTPPEVKKEPESSPSASVEGLLGLLTGRPTGPTVTTPGPQLPNKRGHDNLNSDTSTGTTEETVRTLYFPMQLQVNREIAGSPTLFIIVAYDSRPDYPTYQPAGNIPWDLVRLAIEDTMAKHPELLMQATDSPLVDVGKPASTFFVNKTDNTSYAPCLVYKLPAPENLRTQPHRECVKRRRSK